MKVNITKKVIQMLCEQSEEFRIFFDHHFEFKTKTPLVPKIKQGKTEFKEETVIVPKEKTYEEKLRYYQEDMNYANKKYNYFPDALIIIKGEIEQ